MSDSVREQVLGYLLGRWKTPRWSRWKRDWSRTALPRRIPCPAGAFVADRGRRGGLRACGGIGGTDVRVGFAQGRPSPRRVPRGPAISPQRVRRVGAAAPVRSTRRSPRRCFSARPTKGAAKLRAGRAQPPRNSDSSSKHAGQRRVCRLLPGLEKGLIELGLQGRV